MVISVAVFPHQSNQSAFRQKGNEITKLIRTALASSNGLEKQASVNLNSVVTMFGAPPRTFRRMVCVSTVVFRQIQLVSRIVFYDFDDLRVCNVPQKPINHLTTATTVKVTLVPQRQTSGLENLPLALNR